MDFLRKVDFHMHSNFSDGLFSPQELMKISADAGLAAAGIADHDTISGLPEGQEAAGICGIEFIPGVEISILDDGFEIHMLGYYPRYLNQLKAALEEMQLERFKRMDLIVDKLKKQGFKIKTEEVLAEAGKAAPGRLHLARLLQKKRYVHTPAEAFSLYLSHGRPAYVPRITMSVKQAMILLKEIEAIPVIAHPGEKGKSVVDKLIPEGLAGIEVFHPDHSKSVASYYLELAQEKRLIVTGGTDFHGDNKTKSVYPIELAISYTYFARMKSLIRD